MAPQMPSFSLQSNRQKHLCSGLGMGSDNFRHKIYIHKLPINRPIGRSRTGINYCCSSWTPGVRLKCCKIQHLRSMTFILTRKTQVRHKGSFVVVGSRPRRLDFFRGPILLYFRNRPNGVRHPHQSGRLQKESFVVVSP